jgi:hypothetical protein
MTSLLGLYQRDVESSVPDLRAPAARPVDWIDLVKDYSEDIKERYSRAADVSPNQKKLAAGCLYLALQSLQIGVSVASRLERYQAKDRAEITAPANSRETVLAIVMLCVGILNIWVGSIPGVISVLAVFVLFVHFHWGEISILNGVFPWQSRSRQVPGTGATDAGPQAPTVIDIRSTIESIVRRTDDIVDSALPRTETPPPGGLKQSTLEFFQDVLEAKLSGDRDFAFKKISRTIGQVLEAEGIGLATDAEKHLAMFKLDTVVDDRRENQYETIRPALMQNSKCVLSGYARHFVAA